MIKEPTYEYRVQDSRRTPKIIQGLTIEDIDHFWIVP